VRVAGRGTERLGEGGDAIPWFEGIGSSDFLFWTSFLRFRVACRREKLGFCLFWAIGGGKLPFLATRGEPDAQSGGSRLLWGGISDDAPHLDGLFCVFSVSVFFRGGLCCFG
jgi:hypothetical protein